jgi:hypothetical protein
MGKYLPLKSLTREGISAAESALRRSAAGTENVKKITKKGAPYAFTFAFFFVITRTFSIAGQIGMG